MKTLYLWIMLAMLAMASCSSHDEPELIEPVPPAQEDEPKTVNVQFVVGEYPAFASQGNASDDDKTAWSEADEIFVTFTSPKLGKKTAVLTYRNNAWTTGSTLSYIEGETPEVTALYAPCYQYKDGALTLKNGSLPGLTEYISVNATVSGDKVNVRFTNTDRTYSRLCISTFAGQTLTITTTGFTPAGATSETTESYTLKADNQGSIFLYGAIKTGAIVKVESEGVLWTNHTFSSAIQSGKSYTLQVQPPVMGQSVVFVEGVNEESG